MRFILVSWSVRRLLNGDYYNVAELRHRRAHTYDTGMGGIREIQENWSVFIIFIYFRIIINFRP